MIVPRSRLLWFVGVGVVPFASLGAALPSWPMFTVAVALLALPVIDAVRGRNGLEGIAVALPDVSRLSEGREDALEVFVSHDGNTDRRLRLGLPFPEEVRALRETLVAGIPAGDGRSRVLWPCTPLRRGRYRLDRCYLECPSPMEFWSVRGVLPLRSELRIYPGLLADRKDVGAMFLSKGSFGIHTQRQIGKGREFEKLREYTPGDSYEDIHWKATAKRGRPVTKVFRIERTQEVYVVLDASRLSARPVVRGSSEEGGQNGGPVLDRYVKAAMVLSFAAERQGDLFGLVTFSDRVHHFLRAGSGKRNATACHDVLFDLSPRIVSPDFDELAAFLRLRLRRRALLVFLTALDDPLLAEGFVRSAELFRRQHLALVASIRPPDSRPLFSGPDPASIDDLYRGLGGHQRWHALLELQKILERRGVFMVQPDDERLCVRIVSDYVGIKKRQIL